jgi:hypothetical protein
MGSTGGVRETAEYLARQQAKGWRDPDSKSIKPRNHGKKKRGHA